MELYPYYTNYEAVSKAKATQFQSIVYHALDLCSLRQELV